MDRNSIFLSLEIFSQSVSASRTRRLWVLTCSSSVMSRSMIACRSFKRTMNERQAIIDLLMTEEEQVKTHNRLVREAETLCEKISRLKNMLFLSIQDRLDIWDKSLVVTSG